MKRSSQIQIVSVTLNQIKLGGKITRGSEKLFLQRSTYSNIQILITQILCFRIYDWQYRFKQVQEACELLVLSWSSQMQPAEWKEMLHMRCECRCRLRMHLQEQEQPENEKALMAISTEVTFSSSVSYKKGYSSLE